VLVNCALRQQKDCEIHQRDCQVLPSTRLSNYLVFLFDWAGSLDYMNSTLG